MAVPGNITSKNSFGTNYLIKSGAKLVQQWQDVVTELPAEISVRILPPKLDETKTEEITEKQPKLMPANLSENERRIWALLSPDEPVHIDQLLETSGLRFGDLNTALLGLEMKELVRALPGKTYARKI
jgi:DNA processing protein